VVKLEGTPTSTFGVGKILVDIIRKFVSPAQSTLVSKITRAIDPNKIMSPGKKNSYS
jgi:hypothetical protein